MAGLRRVAMGGVGRVILIVRVRVDMAGAAVDVNVRRMESPL